MRPSRFFLWEAETRPRARPQYDSYPPETRRGGPAADKSIHRQEPAIDPLPLAPACRGDAERVGQKNRLVIDGQQRFARDSLCGSPVGVGCQGQLGHGVVVPEKNPSHANLPTPCPTRILHITRYFVVANVIGTGATYGHGGPASGSGSIDSRHACRSRPSEAERGLDLDISIYFKSCLAPLVVIQPNLIHFTQTDISSSLRVLLDLLDNESTDSTMAPTATVLTPSLADNSGFAKGANPQGVPPTPRAEVRNDGTIQTVDELVRRRAIAHHDRVVVSYPSSGIDYVDYTMQQLDVFAYRVAMGYSKIIPARTSSTEKPSVVAILGPSDLDYLVTMLALIKLGHTVLFLSTRISPAAIESLVLVTGANALLAGAAHLEVARATQQKLEGLRIHEIAPRSTYEFPVEVHADTRLDQVLDSSIEAGNFVYIIHSSGMLASLFLNLARSLTYLGSTGLPKPIYQTHKAALANYAVSMEMKAFITLPLYHNHGICNLFRAIYSGKPIHLYNASLPLTHDYLVSIMKRHRFEIFYGVPYALKLLAESDEGIDILRSLKVVMYGGSACPDDLGNRLVDCDVNLIGHYGA